MVLYFRAFEGGSQMRRFSSHKISELRRTREKSQIVSESYGVVLSGKNVKKYRHHLTKIFLLHARKNDVAFRAKSRSENATIGKS